MLRLTKRTEYGLIALVHLADQAAAAPEGAEADVVSARAIGDQFPVPRRLLAEALKALQQGGILDSTRGAQGGYRLARPASEISLGEIVAALEGAPTLTSCDGLGAAAGPGGCEVEPVCPIRSPLARLRKGIWTLFEGVSLQSLADRSVDPAALFTATP
ncbi:MAG: Rrf2 family transcriptional regulator [Planctomycetota bacterium]